MSGSQALVAMKPMYFPDQIVFFEELLRTEKILHFSDAEIHKILNQLDFRQTSFPYHPDSQQDYEKKILELKAIFLVRFAALHEKLKNSPEIQKILKERVFSLFGVNQLSFSYSRFTAKKELNPRSYNLVTELPTFAPAMSAPVLLLGYDPRVKNQKIERMLVKKIESLDRSRELLIFNDGVVQIQNVDGTNSKIYENVLEVKQAGYRLGLFLPGGIQAWFSRSFLWFENTTQDPTLKSQSLWTRDVQVVRCEILFN